MAYTTINALREDIEDVIAALNPGGETLGCDEYVRTGEHWSWDDRAEASLDRAYTVDPVRAMEPTMFGAVDEIDYQGEVEVTIGHVIPANRRDGEMRRDTDLVQIMQALEKKANFPSGCSLVRHITTDTVEMLESKHWKTIAKYEIHFALAAP